METKWPDAAVTTVAALAGALTGIVLFLLFVVSEGGF